jgi:hypothetical protein
MRTVITTAMSASLALVALGTGLSATEAAATGTTGAAPAYARVTDDTAHRRGDRSARDAFPDCTNRWNSNRTTYVKNVSCGRTISVQVRYYALGTPDHTACRPISPGGTGVFGWPAAAYRYNTIILCG